MTQHTPLYPEHLSAGAKICPFAGYDMPINYEGGVLREHEWVRASAGLFDVSHMGQAVMSGSGAAAYLSRLTPSSFLSTPHGRARYTVLTNERGGIIDDLIITRMDDERFFIVYNAARKTVDGAWIETHLPPGVRFEEWTDRALIALQGPKAEAALARELPGAALADMPYMTLREATWKGVPLLVSRLGYTGEDGFEISLPPEEAAALWRALLAHPEVRPIGLAARDSLRLEMGYPLYGHDLNEETTPVEAGLSWVISKGHEGYNGAAVISAQLASGADRRRVGVKLLDGGIAREGAVLYAGGEPVGALTSGGFSPSLKLAIGQGYVKSGFADNGRQVEAEVRGKRIAAVIHPLSFLPAQTKPSTFKKAS